MKSIALAAGLFLMGTGGALAQTPEALRERALADRTAISLAESLTTEIGARPAGSAEFMRAKNWALAKLTALGFKNVHAEAFTMDRWVRGEESATILAPYPQSLKIMGSSGSPPTPELGLEGEAVLFKTYQELLDAPANSLTGKIAVVTERMPVTATLAGFNATSRMIRGVDEAAKRGAIAYLIRSRAYGNARIPHTGSGAAANATVPIPSASMSSPDTDLLEREAASGHPVRLHIALASHVIKNVQSWNVTGEIPGRSREIVLLGGHLDSWDVGTGAVDDAAGISIGIAAAKLVGETKPLRTVRVVLFGGEEIGLAGPAYAEAHGADAANIVAAGESDLGAGLPLLVRLPGMSASDPKFAGLAELLKPLGVEVSREPSTTGGADVGPLAKMGVPVFWVYQDLTQYFQWHHSDDDTFDKIEPAGLARNVAALAVVAQHLANTTVDLRHTSNNPVHP